jgi:WD40 repeat protein
MTLTEKEEAVIGPAKYAGAEISDELRALLRKHIVDYEISLPVLQHALMRTWDYWLINAEANQPVDIEHYKAIGTVTDALSVHAEQIYGSLPNNELKLVTEKLFKSLTHLGEDNRGTRRPARLDEICKITGTHEEDVITVINEFRAEGNSFLMPVHTQRLDSHSVIDISHESIMRVWKRLVGWVLTETESAQLYLRLAKSAELYQEGKTGLLVNPDLQLALKWKEENQPNETWALRYDPTFERTMNYLEYSRKEYEKALAAKEERQKRNLRRTRYVAIILGVASLISISFLIVALNLKLKAEASEKKALSSERLALEKSEAADVQKREAISHRKIAEQQQLIANEERRMAEEQKLYALQQRKEAIYQKSLALKAKNVAEKAEEEAVEAKQEAERLRDTALIEKQRAEEQKERAELSEARTDTLRRLAVAKSLSVQAVKIFQNNQKVEKLNQEQADLPLIMAYQAYYFNKKYKGNPYDPDVYAALSEVSNSSISIRGQNIHADAVRDVAIAPGGKYFVTCSDDGTVKKFKFTDPENPQNFKMPKDKEYRFRSVAIDPKQGMVMAGTYDGKILVWDSPTNLKTILVGSKLSINQLAVLKEKDKLISVSNDGYIRSWNMADFQSDAELVFQINEKFTSVSVNYDESRFAVASTKGHIRIFDASTYELISTYESNEGNIQSLCWNKKGELLIGYASGKLEMTVDGKGTSMFAHASGVNEIVFDNERNRMITCGYDGKIKIWDYNNLDAEPSVIDGHNDWVYCIALNNDKSMIVSGGADNGILLSKINIEDLKNMIRKNVSKNMSYKNWLNYVGEDIDYFKTLPND